MVQGFSVYDGDTLVCVDTKEPLRIAEIWASKGMTLLAFGRENHDLMIQVMGTSFVNDRSPFVICRNDADCFYANQEVDPYYADLLDEVKEAGIPIEAVRCVVDEDGMAIDSIVPLR